MSMFSVLVADDEWIEREGICLLLEESPYEFEIFMAENGEEAVKILERNRIDILFTDIKMPFMDGLELLAAANQSRRGLKMVIFSAFADFAYAKSAMENHASYYLLKPVDPEEFQNVVTQLVEALELEWEEERKIHYQTGRVRENRMTWLQGGGEAPEEIKSWLAAGGTCWMQLFSMEEEEERTIAAFYEKIQKYSLRILCTVTVSDGICLLVSRRGEDQERIAEELISCCGMKQTCVVLSREIQKEENFAKDYEKMQDMLRFHFFTEGNQIYHMDAYGTEPVHSEYVMQRIIKEVSNGIEWGNDAYVKENLILLREELKGNVRESQIFIKYLYSSILEKVSMKREIPKAEFEEYLERLFSENNLTGIHQIMLEVIQRYGVEDSMDARRMEQKRVIRRVLEIVETRYSEELTLSAIANEVHLSPSYLSYLFKKETGNSLVKYITSIRLKEAKKLLRESNMKISEIATKVGYQNYSYFNISFKSNLGMSPVQYRERGEWVCR